MIELDGTEMRWRYDGTYQLTNAARGTATATLTWDNFTLSDWDPFTLSQWDTLPLIPPLTTLSYNTTYTYDPVGNRLLMEE